MQSFKRLPGMSDAGSLAVAADLANSGVTSFAQQSFAPDQAPQLHREMGPAVAIQPEGFAPGSPPSHIRHLLDTKYIHASRRLHCTCITAV